MKTSTYRLFGFLLILLFSGIQSGRSQAGDSMRFFLLSPERLDTVQEKIKRNDPQYAEAYADLVSRADALVKELRKAERLPSVTTNEYVSPGGTVNDYVSFGPYWWPDPNKPDGLPYIRRDGRVNPDMNTTKSGNDRPELKRMVDTTVVLALAGYLSGNEIYGEQAARVLRCWFLDPKTKMNPNLRFGQAIPGRSSGRGIGIIDTTVLADLPEAIGLLQSSSHWTSEDQAGLVRWFSDYLDWLLTSEHGIKEGREKNNHGTWYDVQVATFSLFVGRNETARKTLEQSKRRIDSQIRSDGKQPHELARTRPSAYSLMNLNAFMRLANLGELVDVDLWGYTNPEGGSIRGAYDFLLPFEKDRTWPYKDLDFKKSAFSKPRDLIGTRFESHYVSEPDFSKPFSLGSFYR